MMGDEASSHSPKDRSAPGPVTALQAGKLVCVVVLGLFLRKGDERVIISIINMYTQRQTFSFNELLLVV